MTLTTRSSSACLFLVATIILLLAATPSRADVLVLTNGDVYSGTIVSMDRSNLVFRSEIQGAITIPRTKLARITLGASSAKPASNSTAARPAVRRTNSLAAASTNGADFAVIEQLRTQGVDTNVMSQLQGQVLGSSSPEATRRFNEMVGGLASGSLSVEDIRAQARSAIKDIQAAKGGLGDDTGDLLDGYLSILQAFVQEGETSAPPAAVAAPAKPASKPAAVSAPAGSN